MIVFLTTGSHNYTHDHVAYELEPFYPVSYPAFFARRRLREATYIFSDFDRLSFWQLELAAHYFRQMKAAGWRVLNDPARALHRLELLQRLKAKGLNSFSAWPASAFDAVDRFPVFVRTQAAHRGNLTDLLHTPEDLTQAIERLVDEGYPIHDLMVSEYCAEPHEGHVFRKLSVYRVGDEMVSAPSVYEKQWTAKFGESGAAGEEGYRNDLDDVRSDRFCAALKPYFEVANIDYGRADFGLVNGKVEVYEINTNPTVEPEIEHPFQDRLTAFQLSDEKYLAALAALDTPENNERLRIELPKTLADRRRRLKLWPGYQWMP